MQSSQANCGPTALYNAACALGKKLSLEECEKACKTSTDGTSPKQLKAGAMKLGLQVVEELKERDSHIAWLRTRHYLDLGCVLIVVVDADEHWATVVGQIGCGNRLLVADSADNELVLSYSAGELLQRWGHPESKKPYYAVVVS